MFTIFIVSGIFSITPASPTSLALSAFWNGSLSPFQSEVELEEPEVELELELPDAELPWSRFFTAHSSSSDTSTGWSSRNFPAVAMSAIWNVYCFFQKPIIMSWITAVVCVGRKKTTAFSRSPPKHRSVNEAIAFQSQTSSTRETQYAQSNNNPTLFSEGANIWSQEK